jgi:hypothetical protein
MSEQLYQLIKFSELKDGESVAAFGIHPSEWVGRNPDMVFVPHPRGVEWEPILASDNVISVSYIPLQGHGVYATRTKKTNIPVDRDNVDSSYDFMVWMD